MTIPLVILAAGHGTRLGALTDNHSKAMLPIAGRPMLDRVLEPAFQAGIEQAIVVLSTQDRAARRYLAQHYPPETVCVAQQDAPTGTVDALQQAAPLIQGDFLLSSVDSIVPTSHITRLQACLRQTSSIVWLSLLPASPAEIRASSGVRLKGELVTAIEEKPEVPPSPYAAIMLYACQQRFLDFLPGVRPSQRGERELASAIQACLDGGHPVRYATVDTRLHLTNEADLLAINRHYLARQETLVAHSVIPASTTLIPPVRIDAGVTVGSHSTIGPYVYLETGSELGESVTLKEAVVLRSGKLAPGTTYAHGVIA